jgi:Na+-transporting methylmalonyl-CoA/oxaloacetate decarboxylase beta subunit
MTTGRQNTVHLDSALSHTNTPIMPLLLVALDLLFMATAWKLEPDHLLTSYSRCVLMTWFHSNMTTCRMSKRNLDHTVAMGVFREAQLFTGVYITLVRISTGDFTKFL